MATPMFPDDPNFFGEDVAPDMMFGLAEIDELKSTTDKNNDFDDDENPFKSTSINTINQNNSYQATAEDLDMVARIRNFLDDGGNAENNKHVRPSYPGPSDGPTIDPRLLTYSLAAEAEMPNPSNTPIWLNGDGHNSSPDQTTDEGTGFITTSSPASAIGDDMVGQQDEPMEDQSNVEENRRDNASVPVVNNVIEVNDERLASHGEHVGSHHAIQSIGVSSVTNVGPPYPVMNPNQLIAYSWQVLQMNEQIPPVLRTVETYDLIRNMVMEGGQGLESGITADKIVALPKVQQFLANVMEISSTLPSANSSTTNPLIFRDSVTNTEAFNANANANNLASHGPHQPLAPNNLATSGSGHLLSVPSAQRSIIENIIQRLGGYQAFRERYIQWRTMALRPVPAVNLSALNVLIQPDVEEFLRSMDIHIMTNMQTQLGSLPVNRSQIAKTNSGVGQHRQATSKATGSKSAANAVVEESSGITDAEAKALVQKHIDNYRKHPAAVNPSQDHGKSVADGNQRTNPSEAKASRSGKPATRKKTLTPSKVPKKIHPNAVVMYKFFGAPVPGEEESNSNQNVQDQADAQTKTTAALHQQTKSNDNAAKPTNAADSGAQPVLPLGATQMNNTSRPAMLIEPTSQKLMLEVRELRRIIREQELIIKNQHGVIQSQQGAIDAQKNMLGDVLSRFQTNQNNTVLPHTSRASGFAHPEAMSTIENRNGPFGLKRSVSVFEGDTISKRRRGVAGFALRAIAGENSAIRDMANSSMQVPVAGHPLANAQDAPFANGSHDAGTTNSAPDITEIEGPYLVPRRRSNRVTTTEEQMHVGSNGNVKEESSDGSNDVVDSSGSDYVPS